MDIGGHRFFSKSDRVMQWWMDLMPPEAAEGEIAYQGKKRTIAVPAVVPEEPVLRAESARCSTNRSRKMGRKRSRSFSKKWWLRRCRVACRTRTW